jgi:hypothetical protein
LPQVIVTAALPALARQTKGVEQRNPRKQSTACQSSKTRATRALGDQHNKEQITRKSRKCNIPSSNVIQTASEDDSTQDVSHSSNQAALRQSTVTWAISVAETKTDRTQSILAKPDQARSEVKQRNPRKLSTECQSSKTRATRAAGDQNNKEQIARKSRKCNTLTSNVVQTASEDDSTEDVSHSSDQAAQCQLTVTWAISVAETILDQPQSTLCKTKSSKIQGKADKSKEAKCSVPVKQDTGNKRCEQPRQQRADYKKIKEV